MNLDIRRIEVGGSAQPDSADIHHVLDRSTESTIFHTPEWNRLITDYFELDNVTLVAYRDREPVGLYAYYPQSRHLCSSPLLHLFSFYGGPVTSCDDSQVSAVLIHESERLNPLSLFEISTPPNYPATNLLQAGFSHKWTHLTPIWNLQATEQDLWSSLDGSKRTKIRKARKLNVEILAGEFSDLDDYRLMVAETLGRADKDALPTDFLNQVLEEFIPKRMAKFLIAKHQGEAVAGSIVLTYKKMVTGWSIGSRWRAREVAANDLLVWELAKWALQEGFQRFDLAHFDPIRQPGIARWKAGFGVEILPYYSMEKRTRAFRAWRIMTFPFSPRRITRRLKRLIEAR